MRASTTSASVLLVDDDPDYSDLLREAFAEAGFRTLLADNGEKALAILREEPVDLVVSDFVMPELNGLELCRVVSDNQRFAHVKVVLYSCNPDNTFRRKAREMGAVEYLPKSEDTEALVQRICGLVGISLQTEKAPEPALYRSATPENSGDPTWEKTGQLQTLMNSLFDLVQIIALSEQATPVIRLAAEAAQRTCTDMKRILKEMEALSREASASNA